MYPGGRLRSVVIKGIDPGQRLLDMPTASLAAPAEGEDIPALIGTRMARATGLKAGDTVTLQWKDAAGTIDARDASIVEVMHTTVPSIDQNQVWVPLEALRGLAAMPGEATLVVVARGAAPVGGGAWAFSSADVLLTDVRQLIQSKAAGSAVLYLLLLFLSMLAIFDTQVLAIFRRRREIGTLVALGMTRGRVIRLFTLEGALHGVLAMAAGAIWGGPLLWWFSITGWELSSLADDYGFALGSTLYPFYSPRLVGFTALVLLVVTTAVSYVPTRRIASLEPTDALRGRLA
jgi:ABC-type lipoprotein release transport system permease subunit